MVNAGTNDSLRARAAVRLAALALAALAPAVAVAAPEGEQVISGEATFARDGSVTQITTSTPQTIVNYTSFDIGRGETVRIDQPDAASRILNNVLSTDPTLVSGVLSSNGQVWIANPVGVFFGDQAIVDVGRLVAAAGTVDAGEFLAGTERWSDLTGRVEVGAGAQIRAADSVLLVGAAVANYGNISAPDGMIALIAGGEVRLARVDGRVIVTADRAVAPDPERWAVVQAGALDAGQGNVSLTAGDAYSLAINHSGITRARDIAVAGGDGGVVSVSGALDASDRSAGATGGAIAVTGDRIALLGAQLDASGDAGGGSVRVGGDLRGGGELPTAKRTVVDGGSSLRADAISTGDGGKIIVWADEATRFYGAASARGGAASGDGGFAEISGASLVARGSVDLGASHGETGTLLYDPKDIVLHAGALDGSDAPDASDTALAGAALGQVLFGTPDELTTPFDVYQSELESTNANIVLQATNSISKSSSSPATFAVRILDNNSLTMLTRNNAGDETGGLPVAGIDLAGVSFQTGGTGAITLATGNDGAGGGGSGVDAGIVVGNLTTAGGAVSLATKDGSIDVGAVTTSGANGTVGATGGTVGLVAGGTGSLTAGNIVAKGGDGSAGAGGVGAQVGIRSVTGRVTVAGIDVSGGTGSSGGAGGAGGTIQLVADLDPESAAPAETGANPYEIVVNGNLIANGGANLSGGALDTAADGGAGGQILASAGMVAEAGSVTLGPGGAVALTANAGAGTGGGGNAATGGTSDFSGAAIGAIRVESHGDVNANANLTANGGAATTGGAGGPGGNGGNLAIVSDRGGVDFTGSVTSQGGAADGTTSTVNGTGGIAVVEGHGAIEVNLLGTAAVNRFEVVETDVTGSVDVTGAGITAQGAGSPGSDVHTITNIDTTDTAPHFTYRLADGGDGAVEQIDSATLRVGGTAFGTRGGTLANARADATAPEGERLLGRIEGAGAANDVTLNGGNLQVFATNIGTSTTRLGVARGAGTPAAELTVAGDAYAAIGAGVAIVDVVQRSASGSIDLDLPGSGVVDIEGTIVDDGASRIETSVVHRVDNRGGGPAFFFHLADATASSGEAGTGEPPLTIESGAVTLGADVGFAAAGDLVLERGAIDGGGRTVVLVADSNRDSAGGAIDALAAGTAPHVANAGALVAIAGSGVGMESASGVTPATGRLHTSGAAGNLTLAGSAGSGDFRIANEAGRVSLATIPLAVANAGASENVSYRGVAANGAVEIDNGARTGNDSEIEFGAVQEVTGESLERLTSAPSFGITGKTVGTDLRYGFGDLRVPLAALTSATADAPHVQSGGSQHYVGPLVIASDQVALHAGTDIRFDDAIDADAAGRALDVQAGGTTTFAGDVGAVTPIDALTVTDARFEGDRSVTVASRGVFRAIEGTGSLALNASDTGSELVFQEDIGVVGDFLADAGRVSFVENMNRIAAGSVSLNTSPPPPTPDRFQYATIADTSGGLSITSARGVTMGVGEKLSSAGPLAIQAGDTVRLSDLAATELSVNAPAIVIQRRAGGPVALPNGALVADTGVDWVANNITTNVVPVAQGVGADPTFVLGSGGIRVGGAIPYDVIRFTPGNDSVTPANFTGSGRALDLAGLGPRVVSDASHDVPHAAPPVLPGLAARPGDEAPSPPRAVSSDEVIAALHCATADGGPCVPPGPGDDPLASERAREIVARYRALVGSEEGKQRLAAAFAPFAARGAPPSALPHALASDPALADARGRVGELAVTLTQVELLGLEREQSESARRAIASDFAAASGVTGLGPDAVLEAVEASGVAALP